MDFLIKMCPVHFLLRQNVAMWKFLIMMDHNLSLNSFLGPSSPRHSMIETSFVCDMDMDLNGSLCKELRGYYSLSLPFVFSIGLIMFLIFSWMK